MYYKMRLELAPSRVTLKATRHAFSNICALRHIFAFKHITFRHITFRHVALRHILRLGTSNLIGWDTFQQPIGSKHAQV